MFKIHASLLHDNKQRFAYAAGWLARQAGWQGWLVGKASWLARLAGQQGKLVGALHYKKQRFAYTEWEIRK